MFFTLQGFKGRLNVRRLMVDKALDSGKRCLEEFEAERSGENASKQRIATSLQRQIDVASERWLKLCSKSEEWQKRVDDAFRVSGAVKILGREGGGGGTYL